MDVCLNAAIERLHETEPGFADLEASDYRVVAPREHTNDSSFDAVVTRAVLDAGKDTVAVHRLFDVAGRDVHVRRVAVGFVRDDESKPARVGLQTSDDKVHLVGKADTAAFGLDELAGRHERFQQPAERRAFFTMDFQSTYQVARSRRVADFVAKEFQNLFTREHGSFTCSVRL